MVVQPLPPTLPPWWWQYAISRFSVFITVAQRRRVSFFLLSSWHGSGHFSTAMDIYSVRY
jgi:hypothetical protein